MAGDLATAPLVGTVMEPKGDTPAFLRVQAILDQRDKGPVGWLSSTETARLILRALFYEDGTDETEAVAASSKPGGVDAVITIECFEAMLTAILGDRA